MKRFIRFLKPTVPRVCWLFIEAIIVMIVTQAWPYLWAVVKAMTEMLPQRIAKAVHCESIWRRERRVGKHHKYLLEASPLYRLRKKKELAGLLHTNLPGLITLLYHQKRYREFTALDGKGKYRFYQEPLGELKRLQKRLHKLLMRIEPPDYLSSPAVGRSNITNALIHRKGKVARTLDIKRFFPSARSSRVFWLFRDGLECSSDVSGILTDICVKDSGLPTGGPTSPILAFYAYKPMWEEINALCESEGCVFSVYVDDLTISGDRVSGKLIWAIKQVIHRYGLRYHPGKERFYREGCPKDITGVIVSNGKLAMPNRQHKKKADHRRCMQAAALPEKPKLAQKLKGLEAYLTQIESV
jgi:hypothetical protein